MKLATHVATGSVLALKIKGSSDSHSLSPVPTFAITQDLAAMATPVGNLGGSGDKDLLSFKTPLLFSSLLPAAHVQSWAYAKPRAVMRATGRKRRKPTSRTTPRTRLSPGSSAAPRRRR